MSYGYYNINFDRLAIWLTSKPLRKQKLIIIIKALLGGHTAVLNSFLNYRDAKIYQLLITPQVVYLEKMLNDRYDSIQRRIYIDDAVWHLPWFLYQEEEEKPAYLFTEAEYSPVYLYTDGEAGEALNDFVVFVPLDVIFSQDEMRSLLDAYKLFGTKYTIQRI